MANVTSEKIAGLLLLSSLKGTLLLIIVWGWLLLFKRVSASMRHWVCSTALTSIIVIPVLALAIPTWWVLLPQPSNNLVKPVYFFPPPSHSEDYLTTYTPLGEPVLTSRGSGGVMEAAQRPLPITSPETSVVTPSAPSAPLHIDWALLVLIGWLAGTLIVFMRWIVQAARVRQMTSRGSPLSEREWTPLCEQIAGDLRIRRHVRLIVSDEIAVPLTWGLWQPVIVLPCEALGWSAERRRIVLTHEFVHIARWDYLTQWIALTSCAVSWFNPLVWKLARQLATERERACDDQVLAMGTLSSEYATNLLEIAQSVRHKRAAMPGVLALVQSSDLARRIRRILDDQQRRHALTHRRSLGLVIALALVLMPLSTMQLSRAGAQNNPIVITIAVEPGMRDAIGQTAVHEFEAVHPGVSVAMVDSIRIPDAADGLDAHLTTLQKYASSADLLFFDGYSLALTPHATRAGLLLDLSPLITSDKTLDTNDFYPQMWSAFQWDNGIWALPIGGDAVVLTYDKAAFDRAGLNYPTGSWTLNDFINAVTKLSVKDLDGHVTASGFANSGRIFRESLWRSLIGANLVDDSVIPNAPHFDTPAISAVIDAYFQLEQQNLISGDVSSAAMFVDTARKEPPPNHGWSLLPGGKSVMLTYGFGISGGTQHPDLAYELLKTLSARPELNGGLPVRKSITGPDGLIRDVPPEYQPLAQQAFANSLNYADLRFTDYLNAAWITHPATAKEAIQRTEVRAVNDVKTASDKKGTLAITVNEPAVAVLPAGKIALKFDMMSFVQPLPTRDQWDKVIADFAASDPQVGLVNLRVLTESPSMAANSSDCFYLPNNAVPSLSGNIVLNLDPFLNADPSFDRSDFIGSILTAVQRDSKTYAYPIGIEPLVMRYNPTRFQAAGVPEPTNTWTIGALTEALQALKPSSEGQPPMVDNGSRGMYLLVLIASYGGVPIDYRTDPPTLHFTDPANVAAIRQTLDLARNGLIKYTALGNLLNSKDAYPGPTTAIYPSSLNNFRLKKAPGSAPDKSVLFPMGQEVNGLAYNIGTAYISAQAQNPDACYRFISTIVKHPELFSTMPVRHSLLSNLALKNAVSPDVLALYNQAETLLRDARTVPFPLYDKGTITLSNMLVQHWLFEAFDAYALGGKDLEPALRDAEAYAKGFLECAASLPPATLLDKAPDSAKSYVECAERADSRLKPVLDPLVH